MFLMMELIKKKVAKLFKFDFVLTSHLAYSISLNISKRWIWPRLVFSFIHHLKKKKKKEWWEDNLKILGLGDLGENLEEDIENNEHKISQAMQGTNALSWWCVDLDSRMKFLF